MNKLGTTTPCVFPLGEAALTAGYGSANVPADAQVNIAGVGSAGISANANAFGYPAATVYVGVTHNADVSLTLPSFAQVDSSRFGTLAAGATNMKFAYKQLFFYSPSKGTLVGAALTYVPPSGSPAYRGLGPAYAVIPSADQPFTETLGLGVAFPVNNTTVASSTGVARAWNWTPQLIPYWQTRGGTSVSVTIQHNFNPNVTPVGVSASQLLGRHLDVSASYGGFSYAVGAVGALSGLANASVRANPALFSVNVSYLIGESGEPNR